MKGRGAVLEGEVPEVLQADADSQGDPESWRGPGPSAQVQQPQERASPQREAPMPGQVGERQAENDRVPEIECHGGRQLQERDLRSQAEQPQRIMCVPVQTAVDPERSWMI